MRDFRTPESFCPYCGYKMDACANPFDINRPKPGDFSVCLECGEPLEFGKNLKLMMLNEDRIFQVILEEPQVYAHLMRVRAAVMSVKEDISKA